MRENLKSARKAKGMTQQAMAERPDRQTNYAEALYGVYDYLKGVERRIAEILVEG